MKKTFKNIRTLAALLIASATLAACSSDDGAKNDEQPSKQASQFYTLTLNAGMGGGAQSRALMLDGAKLVARWVDGDQLTVGNLTRSLQLGGELTASDISTDGQTCTFSGGLSGTIHVDDELELWYHQNTHYTDGTQDGTLASASASDQARAIVTVASVDGGIITVKEPKALFDTKGAVMKLVVKDVSNNSLDVTSMKISVDGVEFFSARPTAATYTANGAHGVLYFAVPSQTSVAGTVAKEKNAGTLTEELLNTWKTNLETHTVIFTATVGSDTYTGTKTGYQLADGQYYATDLTMAIPAEGKSLAESTVGMIVGSDGKAYAATDYVNLPPLVEAVGMVAYKTDDSHGLVIALEDEADKMDWETAKTACINREPVDGRAWYLPSKDDWMEMFKANGGNVKSYSGLNENLKTAGGFASELQKNEVYWTSSENNENTAWNVALNIGGVDAYLDYVVKSLDRRVRACFYF